MGFIHQLLVSRDLGGAGIIALDLVSALGNLGYDSTAWLPGEGAAATRARDLGIKYRFYAPKAALSGSRLKSALCNLRIACSLHSQSPGLIHIHSPFYYGSLSKGLRHCGLKTLVHVHLEEDKDGLAWAFQRPPKAIITCARFLIEYVRSALPERFRDSQQFFSIPNAVDINKFRPGDRLAARLALGASLQAPLIMMVANLAPHKGHATILRAAAILKERGVNALFWFAGVERGGKQFTAELHALAQQLQVTDRVTFLGQRTDIPLLLQAADFFVLPSTSEGLPLSILEAQACRIPVLAAPTAGIPEIIADSKTGYLISADDATGYAQQLQKLIQKPQEYSAIVENAFRNIQQNHTWENYVDKTMNAYTNS